MSAYSSDESISSAPLPPMAESRIPPTLGLTQARRCSCCTSSEGNKPPNVAAVLGTRAFTSRTDPAKSIPATRHAGAVAEEEKEARVAFVRPAGIVGKPGLSWLCCKGLRVLFRLRAGSLYSSSASIIATMPKRLPSVGSLCPPAKARTRETLHVCWMHATKTSRGTRANRRDVSFRVLPICCACACVCLACHLALSQTTSP